MSIQIPIYIWLPALIYGAVRVKQYGFKKWIHDWFDFDM